MRRSVRIGMIVFAYVTLSIHDTANFTFSYPFRDINYII